jgi:hypothetical protein
MGMIFSRLYAGSWKADFVDQDFRLQFHKDSMAGRIRREYGNDGAGFRNTYNTFNLSSACTQKLALILEAEKHAVNKGFKRLNLTDQEVKLTAATTSDHLPALEEATPENPILTVEPRIEEIVKDSTPTPEALTLQGLKTVAETEKLAQENLKSRPLPGAKIDDSKVTEFYDNRVREFLRTVESTEWRDELKLEALAKPIRPTRSEITSKEHELNLIREIRSIYDRADAKEPRLVVNHEMKKGTRDLLKEFSAKYPKVVESKRTLYPASRISPDKNLLKPMDNPILIPETTSTI